MNGYVISVIIKLVIGLTEHGQYKLKNKIMTEQDKLYIKTHREWVKSTKLNGEEHELNMIHNKARLEIINYQVSTDKAQLELNKIYLKAGEEAFSEWCSNNNIDPNVEF